MTTTETERETPTSTEYLGVMYPCSICGTQSSTPMLYAHNTCSQLCAIAAAIVETIDGLANVITIRFAPPQYTITQQQWDGTLTQQIDSE
jgi:hypothetical protein